MCTKFEMMGMIFFRSSLGENCVVLVQFHPMVIIYYISEEVEYDVHGFVNMHLVVEEPWWVVGGGMFRANSSLGC